MVRADTAALAAMPLAVAVGASFACALPGDYPEPSMPTWPSG